MPDAVETIAACPKTLYNGRDVLNSASIAIVQRQQQTDAGAAAEAAAAATVIGVPPEIFALQTNWCWGGNLQGKGFLIHINGQWASNPQSLDQAWFLLTRLKAKDAVQEPEL